jgi:plastocyanin
MLVAEAFGRIVSGLIMKKIIIIFIVLILGTLGVILLKNGTNSSDANVQLNNQAQTNLANNEVIIHDFKFSPEKITVKKGTTVKWMNQDDASHDISPDNPSEDFKPSELLAKGQSYSATFNTIGSYSYHCAPHPYMKAIVEVIE